MANQLAGHIDLIDRCGRFGYSLSDRSVRRSYRVNAQLPSAVTDSVASGLLLLLVRNEESPGAYGVYRQKALASPGAKIWDTPLLWPTFLTLPSPFLSPYMFPIFPLPLPVFPFLFFSPPLPLVRNGKPGKRYQARPPTHFYHFDS